MNSIPKPPATLTTTGKQIYKQLSEYLRESNLLHKVDALLIYQAAVWWEQYIKAIEGIRKHGPTQFYPKTGMRQTSPEMSNLKQAQTALNVLFKKLGIGEEARQKLNIIEGAEYDPMDDI